MEDKIEFGQSLYQVINGEDELRDIGRIFEELLEDIELR